MCHRGLRSQVAPLLRCFTVNQSRGMRSRQTAVWLGDCLLHVCYVLSPEHDPRGSSERQHVLGGHQRAQGRCVGHRAGPHTESVLDAEF